MVGIDNVVSNVEGRGDQFQYFGDRQQAKKIQHIIFLFTSISLVHFCTRAELPSYVEF